jgi:hypothetical protein
MHISPIKGFPHARLGFLAKGAVVEVPEAEGARLIRLGHANPAAAPVYATKIIQPAPVAGPLPGTAGGAEQQSSASPAARVSRQTTRKGSADGAKKKGKKSRGA